MLNSDSNSPSEPPKALSLRAESPTVEKTPGEPEHKRFDGVLMLAAGWLILFTTFGYASAFGVYLDFLARAETASTSNISWIGSSMLFFLCALGLPTGNLLDKGHYKATTAFGCTLFVFSLFMASLAHLDSYYQLYLSLGAGLGIGMGVCYVPTVAIQDRYWRNHKALAMGFVLSGASIGGIVYPIMLNHLLFTKNIGFGPAVRATAYLSLGLLVVANICIFMTLRHEAAPRSASLASSSQAIKHILGDRPYVATIVAYFFIFWGLFFPNFYVQLFAVTHGIDPNVAFYTLPVLNASSFLGRIVLNFVADRFGVFNAAIGSSLASVIVMLTLLKISTVAGIMIFAILYGFFSGGVTSLIAPTTASLATYPGEIGLRVGVSFFVGAFCNISGTPITGALLGEDFIWYKPITFSASTMFAGLIMLTYARHMVAKNRETTAWI
ncbi:MFS general substrate transporter [Mycena floridula]|nr:MFS general substrate transporter [Mycena floridula]